MLFDIPYNFDTTLLSFFKESDKEKINCFYFPLPSSLYHSVIRTDNQYENIPIDKDSFFKHVELLNNFKENSCKLLLQRPDIFLETEEIKEYINAGIKRFCVGSIYQAKIIKDIDKNLEVTASILMQIDEDFLNNYSIIDKYFDNIVLPFKYCNDPEQVKNITTHFPQFKYTLLCNSQCSRSCKGIHHWLLPPYYKGDFRTLCPDDRFQNNTLINPDFLNQYKNIDSFKLIDRSMPSTEIHYQFKLYTNQL